MQKKTIINLFLVAFIYFLLANISEFLFEPTHTFFTIRLAPGFGLVAALIYGLPAIFGIILGELLYIYILHNSEITSLTSIALAANAVLYVYIGIRLIHRYVEHPDYLTNPFACFKFFILGGFVASLIPSLLAVFCISLIDPDVQQLYWLLGMHWWLGQGLGVLIISPITLCVMYKSKSIWQTRIPLIPVILTTLLVFMVISYAYVSTQEKEKFKLSLDQKALVISTAIKLQISTYAEELYRTSSLFEYISEIGPLKFEAFSNNIKKRQPSVHAISYQKLVKADERQSYENSMREIYSNKFQIVERDGLGNFKRASNREEYTPITMRSIYNKNARIMGFDTLTSVYSKLARKEAMVTHQLVISHPFSLDSSKGDNKSIVLILPLKNNNIFSGFVSLSVYVSSAIQSAIENIDMEGVSLKIFDTASSINNIIYTKNTFNGESNSGLIKEGKIDFKSLKWKYEVVPNHSYLESLFTSQLLVIIFCILLATILSVRLLEHSGKEYEFARLFSENEERNRLLLDSTAEAIYGIDLNGECTFANRACLKMLGYQSEGELMGKNMHQLIYHTRDNGTPYPIEESKIYQSSQEGKESFSNDEVLWRADGSNFRSECHSLPILIHGDVIGTVVSFTDISTRIEAKAIEKERFKTLTSLKNVINETNIELVNTQKELKAEQEKTNALLKVRTEELKETQLQLFQAEKMDTIGKLSAGVAHEVKNPLAIILLGINYLQKSLHKNESIDEVIHDMVNAIHRADSVIKELVDFSASKQLKLEKQELNPVIEESLQLIKHEFTKYNINVECQLEEILPFVEIDRSKLQQVFINIFMNAIHAMSTKGTLLIRTYASELKNEIKKHKLSSTGQFRLTNNIVVIEIKDTGSGIKPKNENKIFEPFFTTKNAGVGTGLGLTVTENIVRLHNAYIDIQNHKEGGVIVSIFLKAI